MSKGKKDRLRRIKINKRFEIEKIKKCGSCRNLFNGFCENHQHVAFKIETACFSYDTNEKHNAELTRPR